MPPPLAPYDNGAIFFIGVYCMENGIYLALYELIQNAFYGATALTGWQEMVLTVLATIGCLFVFIVPFIVVYKVIKFICGR